MSVKDKIRPKNRIAESRDRLAAGRHKLQGGAHDARNSLASARKAVRATRRSAKRAGRKAYLDARVGAARRTASRPQLDAKRSIGIAGLVGAAGAFFFDPDSGPRRRNEFRDRLPGAAKRPEGRHEPEPQPGNGQVVAEPVHSA